MKKTGKVKKGGVQDGSKAVHAPTHESVRRKREERRKKNREES